MFDHLPQAWLPLVKDASMALIIVLVVAIFYLLVNRLIGRAKASGRLSDTVATIFRVILRGILLPLALLMVLDQFGIFHDFWAWFLGIIALIAIGFVAVWSILSNVLCTLLILIYKPFRVGENVEIPSDNMGGEVIDLNLFFTTLREDSGDLIQVPNNLFFQKPIRRTAGNQKVDLYDQLLKNDPTE
jgi:small-conductance mechanosensitive channel